MDTTFNLVSSLGMLMIILFRELHQNIKFCAVLVYIHSIYFKEHLFILNNQFY